MQEGGLEAEVQLRRVLLLQGFTAGSSQIDVFLIIMISAFA
jgi:hypothetical protein